MIILYTVLMFVLGASLTSFFTVIGMRLPKKMAITGRSVCDHCKETIPWFALIPIAGYIIARGRCVRCEVKISWRYPLLETLGGLLFAAPFLFMGFTPEYAIYLLFVSMMIIVTVSDIDHMIVPDVVLLVFFVPLTVLRLVFPLYMRIDVVLGAVLAFIFMYLLALYGKKRFKKDALGGGDIKLYVIIGIFLSVRLVFLSLFFAAVLGLICAKMVMKKRTVLPFVPFIFGGVILAYFLGPFLLEWYLGLF